MMFFDGEEAYKEWTETDSLYGSRHLAKKLKDTFDTNYPGTKQIDNIVSSIGMVQVTIALLSQCLCLLRTTGNYTKTNTYICKEVLRVHVLFKNKIS